MLAPRGCWGTRHVWGRAGGSLRLACGAQPARVLPLPTSPLRQLLLQPAAPHCTVHTLLSAQLLCHCPQKPTRHRSAEDTSASGAALHQQARASGKALTPSAFGRQILGSSYRVPHKVPNRIKSPPPTAWANSSPN